MNDIANKVQKRASVHEKTVQAVAKKAVASRPRKPRKAPQRRTEPVSHTQLHPEALAAVREILATEGTSYTRYDIADAETAYVR